MWSEGARERERESQEVRHMLERVISQRVSFMGVFHAARMCFKLS